MNTFIKYSIVIPTLNEKENIIKLIAAIEEQKWDNYEIIVVDEHSPDGTCQAVNEYAAGKTHIRGIMNDGTPGLSPSIVAGFSHAAGEILCCMDGDMQHDARDLRKLLTTADNYDFVIGSRYADGGGFADKWSFSRTVISRTAALLTRLLLKVKVKDPMSGFFAIKKSAFEEVKSKLTPKGFKIMLEMLFLLVNSERNYTITEIGIVFRKRYAGKSKLSMKVIGLFLSMLLELRNKNRRIKGF